ncbi:capsule polysaccharide export protein [Gluconobacter thailandicus F149-1 = NBRC 100600]|nr:polysaccharide biosynthesis/export family protein [Gluconobacter thailandicus]GAN91761.1 capsule polysaccharide export protein [Gluconobacter frateurii M-2]GAN94585.1 capsule polysaccharide export protein [Gluconobacter thailandicus F149-1 = NBRC 100600]GEL88745.1 sugar ABC transporter substrate-binding protein [Gluconobacter thailandicus F149-1 = NBRC 100600]
MRIALSMLSIPVNRLSVLLPLMAWVGVAGCSALPESAPTESRVLASVKSPAKNPLGYQIIPITPDTTDILSSEVPPLISSLDESGATYFHNDRIGPGDLLTITIFELGNGLFSPGGGATAESESSSEGAVSNGISAGVTHQSLPPTQVEADGTIAVPFVGRLSVSGLTPQFVAEQIRQRLSGKSQNPQVMVRISNDISNTVIVSGEVHRPGRIVLSTAEERLSDLVAIAGGALYPPEDTHVSLVRGERTGSTDLGTLESHPHEDIRAHPGDRIHIIYQPRTYTIFGATGNTVAEIPFKSPNLSLAEAVARAGGPNDNRADPNAVFLFRFEDPVAAKRLHLTATSTALGTPVVYKIDMMDPTNYLLSQKIPVKNKDVILIANAKTGRFYKFNQLISTLISPAITAAWIAK